MFPSSQVELPPADKFNAFPEPAQKAILAAFEREQQERHGWLKNQQSYDHQMNLTCEGHYFVWKMTGTISASFLSIAALLVGGWLVRNGSTGVGVGAMLFAIATLVGTAIYGHRAEAKKKDGNGQQISETSET